MAPRTLCVLVATALSSGGTAPRVLQQDTIRGWMTDLHRAAGLYRAGETAAALSLLDERSISEHKLAAKAILAFMDVPYAAPVPRDDRGRLLAPWDHQHVHALAALYMEAALRVYANRTMTTAEQLRVEAQ